MMHIVFHKINMKLQEYIIIFIKIIKKIRINMSSNINNL